MEIVAAVNGFSGLIHILSPVRDKIHAWFFLYLPFAVYGQSCKSRPGSVLGYLSDINHKQSRLNIRHHPNVSFSVQETATETIMFLIHTISLKSRCLEQIRSCSEGSDTWKGPRHDFTVPCLNKNLLFAQIGIKWMNDWRMLWLLFPLLTVYLVPVFLWIKVSCTFPVQWKRGTLESGILWTLMRELSLICCCKVENTVWRSDMMPHTQHTVSCPRVQTPRTTFCHHPTSNINVFKRDFTEENDSCF